MQVVPFTSDYDQTFTTQLGDDRYLVDARWDERAKLWTFDLTRDSDQELLVAGVPMLAGQDVLAPYALGIGGLMVADLTNTDTEPGPDDLGDRAIVVFMDQDELAILAAGGVTGIVSAANAASGAAGTSTGGAGGAGGGTGTTGGTTIINTTVNQTVNNFSSVGAGGFSSSDAMEDASGSEVLAFRFVANPITNPNPTIPFVLGFIGTGAGTVSAYVGGTVEPIGNVGIPTGTAVGAPAGVGGGPSLFWISGTIANPAGVVLVKVTLKSSAPGTNLLVESVVGSLG